MTPLEKAIEKLTALRTEAQERVDAYSEALDALTGSSGLISQIQSDATAQVEAKDAQLNAVTIERDQLKIDKQSLEASISLDII